MQRIFKKQLVMDYVKSFTGIMNVGLLYAKYKDTLLSPDKKRYPITRDMIYYILNKTVVSVREGLNVHDLLPLLKNMKYTSEFLTFIDS